MSEHRSPARAALVGCGLALALAVLAAIAVFAVVAWWLYRADPPRPDVVLADGRETLALEGTLRADEPAASLLADRLARELVRLAGGNRPLLAAPSGDEFLALFPIRFELVRYPSTGTGAPSAPSAVRVRFLGSERMPRAVFRLLAASAGSEGPMRRAEAVGLPLVVFDSGEGEIAATFLNGQLVLANGRDLLTGLLEGSGRAPAGDRVGLASSVHEQIALENEDGWAYGESEGLPWSPDGRSLDVVSFDLLDADSCSWRASIHVSVPPSDTGDAATAAFADHLRLRFPSTLDLTIETPPRWVDDRTAVFEGRATGIEALIASILTIGDGAGSEPASPRP